MKGGKLHPCSLPTDILWRSQQCGRHQQYPSRSFNASDVLSTWSHFARGFIWLWLPMAFPFHLNLYRIHRKDNLTGAWWRHQMGPFSALLILYEGYTPVTGEIPSQRPVTRSFDVYFDLRPNKRVSKHSSRRWFETPSRSLWRRCNVFMVMPFLGVSRNSASQVAVNVPNQMLTDLPRSAGAVHLWCLDMDSLASVRCGSNVKSISFAPYIKYLLWKYPHRTTLIWSKPEPKLPQTYVAM